MFVIPIEDSLVYVEPVYLEAANSTLPEVKRVIVYYKDRISYKPTLAEALDDMFGENSGTFATGEAKSNGSATSGRSSQKAAPTQKELIQMASDAYDDAISAQQEGDWATYGKKIKEVKSYLNQLGATSSDADDSSIDTVE
jgi:uncharacterized membrane protein (UPF0182 family)